MHHRVSPYPVFWSKKNKRIMKVVGLSQQQSERQLEINSFRTWVVVLLICYITSAVPLRLPVVAAGVGGRFITSSRCVCDVWIYFQETFHISVSRQSCGRLAEQRWHINWRPANKLQWSKPSIDPLPFTDFYKSNLPSGFPIFLQRKTNWQPINIERTVK